MARSRWKLMFFSKSIWRKLIFFKKNTRIRKRIFFDRSSSVPSCFVSRVIRVHKGRKSRSFSIGFLSIGKKFGEFSFTRKPYHFPSKKKHNKNILLRR